MLAYYLHDLSPVIIQFSEKFKIHWYGLAYVMGFYCCYLVMVHLAKKGLGSLKPDQVGDFITFAALFGVVLGGRLGYMLLYNFEGFIRNPISLFRLWDGGMASHGGIAGLALFSLWFAKRHKISWTGIGDNLVVGSPLGILFGRLANFINGELYGRKTDVSWAMKFPTEVHDPKFPQIAPSDLGISAAGDVFPKHSNEIVALAKSTPDGLQKLQEVLTPRHPSQLYEAACEGLLLFLVLYFVRVKFKNLPNGVLTGLFFILYAISRISVETLREPDSELMLYDTLTKGQFYSIFMIAIGLAFLIFGFKWGQRPGVRTAEGK
ncbi:phosphatidylglycerol:prolipoprotein diacylglycerol transferase [Roseimicrobium gellanilyticum]|uniref:Phosphatidylglycerol--prolipoprotein diacylglyceryl transferase n=1 Tax=Roseimicrobium gellanilyticum TaxID=748857 RepID=A0A366H6M6_9BACT|nr:prolipoprotein diacylglyceryl transferase [Roseimicrobium gellanilyticum]RBP37653.1 phosphatidylglycerol:prolipoprotein diacylglycerol transferase [Roseimicrobium gellanilyticum]